MYVVKDSLRAAFLTCLVLILFGSDASAQCSNSVSPSCEVYTRCFAKFCQCAGDPNEYFERYGLTYCKSFLAAANFSPEGMAWRDKTLVCLQEAIVPRLNLTDPPSACNCGEMRSYAFATHVMCYTHSSASICALPTSDVLEVARIIKTKDALTSEGLKQTAGIAKICTRTAPDNGRRTAWKAIYATVRPFE